MPTVEAKLKPYNEDLRQKLSEYRERQKLTLVELASQLNCGASSLSKYLSKKGVGEIEKLEAVAEDVLKFESRRRESVHRLEPNKISKLVDGAFETIRRTNDCGLIFAAAGVGKTASIELYCRENPATITACATKYRCAAGHIVGLLWSSIGTRGWPGNVSRANYLAEKLKGSNRLIIIDNAHRLAASGREYLFDLHDDTGCPIAFVGNPEVLDIIRKNDQQFSRIGYKLNLAPKKDEIRKVSAQLLEILAPGTGDDLEDLAEVVCEHHGHFRALRKQVQLAQKILSDGGEIKNLRKAFEVAHRLLVRDYSLPQEAA